MINQHDVNPNDYGKNKIVLDEKKMEELERERESKGKPELDGIGEEVNDLFLSNVENEEDNEEVIKQV